MYDKACLDGIRAQKIRLSRPNKLEKITRRENKILFTGHLDIKTKEFRYYFIKRIIK